MEKLTVKGIVIKVVPFKEKDRIIHILTDKLGVISASAKGALRTNSRLVSSTSLMMYSEFVLVPGKNMYIVDEAVVLTHFQGLWQDVYKLSLAMYFLELIYRLSPDEPDLNEHLRLALNTIYFLEKGKRKESILKPLFELRLLSMCGYMPDLVACSRCGNYEGDQMFFSPAAGDLICSSCITGADNRYFPVSPAVLAAMRHTVYSPLEKLFAFDLEENAAQQFGMLAEQYLLAQTDGYFKSLNFLKSLNL